MPVSITEHDEGRTIEVVARGKLEKADYETFLPRFEAKLAEFERINILFVMEDFDGFDMWALWEDIKLEWNHYDDISKLAMVGESDWKNWMATFCKPFLKAEIRAYLPSEIDEAREWVRQYDE